MTETIDVPAFEHGVVRVFAGRFGGAAALEAYARPDGARWPLRDELKAGEIDPRGVEAFPAGNVKGMGLPGYLRMAYGVAEAEARGAVPAEGEDGLILMASRAFGGEARTLRVPARLRYLGAFRDAEALASPAPATRLSPARPGSGSPEAAPVVGAGAAPAEGSVGLQRGGMGRAVGAGGLALGALLVAGGLLAGEWLLWAPGLVAAALGAAALARSGRGAGR